MLRGDSSWAGTVTAGGITYHAPLEWQVVDGTNVDLIVEAKTAVFPAPGKVTSLLWTQLQVNCCGDFGPTED